MQSFNRFNLSLLAIQLINEQSCAVYSQCLCLCTSKRITVDSFSSLPLRLLSQSSLLILLSVSTILILFQDDERLSSDLKLVLSFQLNLILPVKYNNNQKKNKLIITFSVFYLHNNAS